MNIVLLGPPGIEKKKISESLANILGMHSLSTSYICNLILNDKSHPYYNHIIKSFEGNLIDDKIILQILSIYMQTYKDELILTGFPKTVEQAKFVDKLFLKNGTEVTHVFNLEYNTPRLVEMLYGRKFCLNCNRDYLPHITTTCTLCNSELIDQSIDEIIETIDIEEEITEEDNTKLKYTDLLIGKIDNYHKIISPVISYYTQRNKVSKIKLIGNESSENIATQIASHIITLPDEDIKD